MTESLDMILNTAATGLSAQSIRMSTISSNLANAGSQGSTEAATYHKKYPIFSEIVNNMANGEEAPSGVRVSAIESSKEPLAKKFDPNNPLANEQGYVFLSNVNPIEEMTDMLAASKEYEANIDLMNTTKSLMNQTINVLKD